MTGRWVRFWEGVGQGGGGACGEMTGLWAGHGSEILSSLLAAWANHSFPGPRRFDNSHLSNEAADVGAGVKCRSHLSYCFPFPQALLQPHAVTRAFRPFTCPFFCLCCLCHFVLPSPIPSLFESCPSSGEPGCCVPGETLSDLCTQRRWFPSCFCTIVCVRSLKLLCGLAQPGALNTAGGQSEWLPGETDGTRVAGTARTCYGFLVSGIQWETTLCSGRGLGSGVRATGESLEQAIHLLISLKTEMIQGY